MFIQEVEMVSLLEELCLLQLLSLHAQHARKFSYFSNVHLVYPQRKELMLALSMRVRNRAEHSCQELMRALSICIRNWCVH
jgi:hypothetical protein